jgi:hypothetical protein
VAVVEFYFFGLIAHVGDDRVAADYGVMVHGNNYHHSGWVHFSSGKDSHGNAVSDVPVGNGDDVNLGSAQSSANTTFDFRNLVPSLGMLSSQGAALKREVKNKSAHNEADAFIGYPAGNSGLDVADCYPDGATFTAPDIHHEQCVARLTVTRLTTNDPVPVTIGASTYYAQPDSWVLIQNVGQDMSGMAMDHFEEYKHLTDAISLTKANRNTRLNCGCTNGKLIYLADVQAFIAPPQSPRSVSNVSVHTAATEIECTNSQFP